MSTPTPTTGTITGRVTDRDTGAPLAGVYIAVGYKTVQLAGMTDGNGVYTVREVPAGLPAPVFAFVGRGYRYHNSIYDDHLNIVLQPGQTYAYTFSTYRLNDPQGAPLVRDPSILPARAAPGATVTFGLTARDGKGGLSDEVLAISPQLGRLALLRPQGGDRFAASFHVPPGTPPGDYMFAFLAASNDCYDNATFPRLTLTVSR